MSKKVVYADVNYKKKLADFMESVNPKPSADEIDQLRKQYLSKREEKA